MYKRQLNDGTIVTGAQGLTFGADVAANVADNGLILGTGTLAATFNDTDDIFEIQPNSTTTGIIDAAGGTDTLVLGGVGSATFDRSRIGDQFLNFENFVKEDLSTFTLTGPDQEVSFDITGGELVVAADTTLSNSTPFTVTSGITRVVNAETGLDQVVDSFGTLILEEGFAISTDTANTNAINVVGGLDAPLINLGVGEFFNPISGIGVDSSNRALSGDVLSQEDLSEQILLVQLNGNVSTSGDGSGGIVGTDSNGNTFVVDLFDSATITTTGDNAAGISSAGESSISALLTNQSAITTTGVNSAGITIGGGSILGTTLLEGASISTSGNDSSAISAQGGTSSLSLMLTGDLSTTGNNSAAIAGPDDDSICLLYTSPSPRDRG